jgi:hypothetical protein
LDEAAVTLFALLTGDDIHDTFSDIIDGAYPVPVVSRLYIYTFVTIFITSVLNVFIFIIEDSFHYAKMVCVYQSQVVGRLDEYQLVADTGAVGSWRSSDQSILLDAKAPVA